MGSTEWQKPRASYGQYGHSNPALPDAAPPQSPPGIQDSDRHSEGRTEAVPPHSTQQRRTSAPLPTVHPPKETLIEYAMVNPFFHPSDLPYVLTCHLGSLALFLSFFHSCQNVSHLLSIQYNTDQDRHREGARPAVLVTPAAHMRHHEGCNRG